MALAERHSRVEAKAFFVDKDVHPQTLAVMRTRAEPLGWTLIVGDPLADLDKADVLGALLQYPGSSGAVRDLRPAIATLKAKGALAIVAADLLALTLLASPGELGRRHRDRLGAALWRADGLWRAARGLYGGARCAEALAARPHRRPLRGLARAPAYRLALQTREQHIRREKATSNICTAQVLLAVIASMYAVYHGPEGLAQIARNVHRRAAVLAAGLRKLGFAPQSDSFFDTLSVDAGAKRAEIVARAAAEKINLGVGETALRIALDETTTPATVEAVWRAFGGTLAYAEIDADRRARRCRTR